jgi:hypothetical protein
MIKNLLKNLFNKRNLNKIIIIFTFGFISRLAIKYYFSINVFVDIFNYISIIYYLFFSCFVVFVHDYIYIHNFSIIPDFIIALFSYTFNSFVTTFIFLFSHFKLKYFQMSFIKKFAKDFFISINNRSKLFLSESSDKVSYLRYDNDNDNDKVDFNSQEYLIFKANKDKSSANINYDKKNLSDCSESKGVRKITKEEFLSNKVYSEELDGHKRGDEGKGKDKESLGIIKA